MCVCVCARSKYDAVYVGAVAVLNKIKLRREATTTKQIRDGDRRRKNEGVEKGEMSWNRINEKKEREKEERVEERKGKVGYEGGLRALLPLSPSPHPRQTTREKKKNVSVDTPKKEKKNAPCHPGQHQNRFHLWI